MKSINGNRNKTAKNNIVGGRNNTKKNNNTVDSKVDKLISIFREQYEENMRLVDSKEANKDYSIDDTQLSRYIKYSLEKLWTNYFQQQMANNKSKIDNNNVIWDKKREYKQKSIQYYDLWLNLFKTNRHLLYLDQFINYSNLGAEIDGIEYDTSIMYNEFIDLPIARSVMNDLLSNKIESLNVLNEYSTRVYNGMKKLMKRIYSIPRKITHVTTIYTHCSLDKDNKILVVPNDIILGFITPINYYGFADSGNKGKYYAEVHDRLVGNNAYFNAPECHLRDNKTFFMTTYYYPGQIVQNWKLSLSLNVEIDEMGAWNQLDKYDHDLLFNKSDTEYYTNLADIFQNPAKLSLFKNSVMYVMGCRRCQLDTEPINVELLYRTEHILSMLQKSNCIEKSYNLKYNNLFSEKMFAKVLPKHEKYKLQDITLFYDPALGSIFSNSTHVVKQHHYKIKDDIEFMKILDLQSAHSGIQIKNYKDIEDLRQKIKDKTESYQTNSIAHKSLEILANILRGPINKVNLNRLVAFFEKQLMPYIKLDSSVSTEDRLKLSKELRIFNITYYLFMISNIDNTSYSDYIITRIYRVCNSQNNLDIFKRIIDSIKIRANDLDDNNKNIAIAAIDKLAEIAERFNYSVNYNY